MDVNLAKTFVAVYETGNFNRAAEKLNVTQSTVSIRIQNLEHQLGRALFVRSRAGTELTVAGQRFYPHATHLLRIWQQARHDLVLPEAIREVFSIGGQFTLWDELLLSWLPWMRETLPEVALRAEVGFPQDLIKQLQEGLLDIGVMYTPQARSGLTIEELLEDKLVLVSSSAEGGGPDSDDYVFIDWGPEFQAEHDMAYMDSAYPAISVSQGMLGLQHILNCGGSGYLPKRFVQKQLDMGRLYRVADAPSFSRAIYMVFPAERVNEELFAQALSGLRTVAAQRQSD